MTEKFGKSKFLPQKLSIAQTNELRIAIFPILGYIEELAMLLNWKLV